MFLRGASKKKICFIGDKYYIKVELAIMQCISKWAIFALFQSVFHTKSLKLFTVCKVSDALYTGCLKKKVGFVFTSVFPSN